MNKIIASIAAVSISFGMSGPAFADPSNPSSPPSVKPAPSTEVEVTSDVTVFKTTPGVSLNVSPEPVTAGQNVKLSGKVGGNSTSRNNGRISFFFRRHNSNTYTLISTVSTSNAGYYTRYQKQTTSGYWKATFWGNAYRNQGYSGVDYVQARQYHTVFSKSGIGPYSIWISGVWAHREASVKIVARCEIPFNRNYVDVTWDSGYWDEATASTGYFYASKTVTRTIFMDDTYGPIDIDTYYDCHWTVTIKQARTV